MTRGVESAPIGGHPDRGLSRRLLALSLAALGLALSLAALGLALVLGAALLFQKPPPLHTERLPDGSVVSLLALTYGRQHRLLDGTRVQRWARKMLPAGVAARLGVREYIRTTGSDQLLCWVRVAPDPGVLGNYGVVVASEDGCHLDWAAAGRAWYSPPERGLITCPVDTFPRRGARLRVRLYEYPGIDEPRILAEFLGPNPVPGPYPEWSPDPLPVTRADGEVTLTLLDLVSGVPPPEGLRLGYPESNWCRARVRLHLPAGGRGGWEPAHVRLRDAAGNRAGGGRDLNSFARERPDGDWDLWFGGKHCPEESALSVRVECVWNEDADGGAESPAPETVWKVHGLALPGPGGRRDVARSHRTQGLQLSLYGVTRAGGDVGEGFQVMVLIRDNARAEDRKLTLTLAQASDQVGRELDGVGSGGSHSQGERYFLLRPRDGTRSMDLTFLVRRSRVMEFRVRPRSAAEAGTG